MIRFINQIKKEFLENANNLEQIEERLESFLEALRVFCFRLGLNGQEYGNKVRIMHHTSGKLGVALDDLPGHVNELATRAASLKKDIDQLNLKKQQTLNDYRLTMDTIEDILSHHGPYILEEYQKNRYQLRNLENELKLCKEDLFDLKLNRVKKRKKLG